MNLVDMPFPVRFFVNAGTHLVPLSAETEKAVLPCSAGGDVSVPGLTYGFYFEALRRFFLREDWAPLTFCVSQALGKDVGLSHILGLDLISEKHGAFYHVCRARAKLSDATVELAVNTAAATHQKAFLENEVALLRKLQCRIPKPFLPRVMVSGETFYLDEEGRLLPLRLFVAEWFTGFHEFHLARSKDATRVRIKIWDGSRVEQPLTVPETHSLFRKMAWILTCCFDGESFEQVYPWHHAAGDFVARRNRRGVDVRLVTVRDYRPLVAPGQRDEARWMALLHFLALMTVRLRVDRIDGTGELAWADASVLPAAIEGFLEAWEEKPERRPGLPAVADVLDLLLRLDKEEWRMILHMALDDAVIEEEERPFLEVRLKRHAKELYSAVRKAAGPRR